MNAKEKFKEYLRQENLKFTPERKDIIEGVFSLHSHFDAEELQEKLKKEGKNISRATIYRTLPLLIDSGLIRETLHCREKVRYEHIYGHKHHDHMICINCGKIIEFSDRNIGKLQRKICNKKDFFPVEYKLGIKGYCKECAKKFLQQKSVSSPKERRVS